MTNKNFSLIVMAIAALIATTCTSKQKVDNVHAEEVVDEQPLFTGALGVQTYSFRHSFPNGVAETLDTIQSMGFTEIEAGDEIDANTYKKLCDERGLSIVSVGVDYQLLMDSTQKIIDRAKILGAKYIMVAWIPHDSDEFTLDDANRAIADFNKVGKELSEHGLTLCYHAHGYEFQPYHEGTLLDYMMEQTEPQYVSFEMDIFWVHFGGGDPVALMEKYPNRWKLMHLKDMKKGISKDLTGHTDVENNVPLGTGEVDVEGVLRAAREAGVKHYFIEDESSRIITQIPQSITYMKSLKL